MTQEENPLGGLLGGIEGALGSTAGGGASGGIGSAAGGNAVSQIMGVLEGAPGAGTAQAGQAINPSVLTGVLGMLGGATGAGSTGVGTSGPGTTNVNALVDQLKAGGLASEVEIVDRHGRQQAGLAIGPGSGARRADGPAAQLEHRPLGRAAPAPIGRPDPAPDQPPHPGWQHGQPRRRLDQRGPRRADGPARRPRGVGPR